jgi:hypothetical protein
LNHSEAGTQNSHPRFRTKEKWILPRNFPDRLTGGDHQNGASVLYSGIFTSDFFDSGVLKAVELACGWY